MGTCHPGPSLKSLPNKVGGMLCGWGSPDKYRRLHEKLERKMIEVRKTASGRSNFKSIDSIIMKFPQFKEGFTNLRGVFLQYDEDSNGSIDREELKKCLEKLQLHLSEEEVEDLFHSCDVDGSQGIQFNEFIVLLCIIYLLMEPDSSPDIASTTSKMGSPDIESTFNTIVDVFLFLDKNGDGKLNKKDMIKALNDSTPLEKSPAYVTRTRFKEMDWVEKGEVSFREFLFAFINWVGIDSDEEEITVE
ncbi:hypothetical protein SLE2022_256050 [Rubroshorea leprosula]